MLFTFLEFTVNCSTRNCPQLYLIKIKHLSFSYHLSRSPLSLFSVSHSAPVSHSISLRLTRCLCFSHTTSVPHNTAVLYSISVSYKKHSLPPKSQSLTMYLFFTTPSPSQCLQLLQHFISHNSSISITFSVSHNTSVSHNLSASQQLSTIRDISFSQAQPVTTSQPVTVYRSFTTN